MTLQEEMRRVYIHAEDIKKSAKSIEELLNHTENLMITHESLCILHKIAREAKGSLLDDVRRLAECIERGFPESI